MQGRVTLQISRVSDGVVVERIRSSNLFLSQGYDSLLRLLGGSLPETRFVDRMQFGSGTRVSDRDDEVLQSPISPIVAIDPVTGVVFDDIAKTVTFTAYLLVAQANGFRISEAALLSVDTVVLARSTFTGRSKTSDYIFRFDWTIQS